MLGTELKCMELFILVITLIIRRYYKIINKGNRFGSVIPAALNALKE